MRKFQLFRFRQCPGPFPNISTLGMPSAWSNFPTLRKTFRKCPVAVGVFQISRWRRARGPCWLARAIHVRLFFAQPWEPSLFLAEYLDRKRLPSFRRRSGRIAFARTGPRKARSAGRSKRLSVPVREHMNSLAYSSRQRTMTFQNHDGSCHDMGGRGVSFNFVSCVLSRTCRGRINGNTKRETH
jgi:hypothetical protein